jgi:S-adenosylmethionine decarboxylase
MNVGTEWLVDVYDCDAAALTDVVRMRAACHRIIAGLDLRVVGAPLWHEFPPPGGVTGIYLLTESHLACHTYPEHRLATFNLYCCRPSRAWPWQSELAAVLGDCRVVVRKLTRGAQIADATHTADSSATRRHPIGALP